MHDKYGFLTPNTLCLSLERCFSHYKMIFKLPYLNYLKKLSVNGIPFEGRKCQLVMSFTGSHALQLRSLLDGLALHPCGVLASGCALQSYQEDGFQNVSG